MLLAYFLLTSYSIPYRVINVKQCKQKYVFKKISFQKFVPIYLHNPIHLVLQ